MYAVLNITYCLAFHLFPLLFPGWSFRNSKHDHHDRQVKEHGMLDDKLKNIACWMTSSRMQHAERQAKEGDIVTRQMRELYP